MSTKNVGEFEAEASQEVFGWPTFQVLKHLGGHAVCTNIGKKVSGMIAHTHTPQSILATTLDPRLLKSQNCSHIFKNEFIALGVIMKRKNQLEYSAFFRKKSICLPQGCSFKISSRAETDIFCQNLALQLSCYCQSQVKLYKSKNSWNRKISNVKAVPLPFNNFLFMKIFLSQPIF